MDRIFLPIVILTLGVLPVRAQQPNLGTEAQRAAGKVLYDQKCAQCHGIDGDGNGIARYVFRPAPRDFTAGIYKFRTSTSGELPTDEDLKRSIRHGMPYTGMPPWPRLSESDVANLAYYLKTFNSDFSGPYGIPETIEVPKPPRFSEESARRGRDVYLANQCADCHGQLGRGDGPSAPTLEDQWGQPIRAADMTKRWTFRGGSTREDIYRTFTTGLDGTPMPSFSVGEDDQWALVDYVFSLSRDKPEYAAMVVAKYVDGPIDLSNAEGLFAEAQPAYFPVVGQVIEPGRSFYPGVNGIEVRAVYGEGGIALMLTWHDMTADRDGSNSPALAVPRIDPGRADPVAADPAGPGTGSADPAGPGTGAADPAGPGTGAADLAGPDPGAADPAGPGGRAGFDAPGGDRAGQFSDAVAVQLPAARFQGSAKPYFLFGDRKRPAELWFADLATETASRFIGRGAAELEPADGPPAFQAQFADGAWVALFHGTPAVGGGADLEPGTFIPIAFSVWDGFSQERGNRRGITSWYHLYLEPAEGRSAAIPMAKYGLITLLLELGIVFLVRRKHNRSVAA